VTRTVTQSTQAGARFTGSVHRGWRVVRLPTRVGMYARVRRNGAGVGDHGCAGDGGKGHAR
jgi:hypothetical protein